MMDRVSVSTLLLLLLLWAVVHGVQAQELPPCNSAPDKTPGWDCYEDAAPGARAGPLQGELPPCVDVPLGTVCADSFTQSARAPAGPLQGLVPSPPCVKDPYGPGCWSARAQTGQHVRGGLLPCDKVPAGIPCSDSTPLPPLPPCDPEHFQTGFGCQPHV